MFSLLMLFALTILVSPYSDSIEAAVAVAVGLATMPVDKPADPPAKPAPAEWKPIAYSGYNAALAAFTANPSHPFIIVVGATWCGACQALKTQRYPIAGTNQTSTTIEYLQTQGYVAELDLDKDKVLIDTNAGFAELPINRLPAVLVCEQADGHYKWKLLTGLPEIQQYVFKPTVTSRGG